MTIYQVRFLIQLIVCYGLRTWIEYGFDLSQDELGWADCQIMTSYQEIEDGGNFAVPI